MINTSSSNEISGKLSKMNNVSPIYLCICLEHTKECTIYLMLIVFCDDLNLYMVFGFYHHFNASSNTSIELLQTYLMSSKGHIKVNELNLSYAEHQYFSQAFYPYM